MGSNAQDGVEMVLLLHRREGRLHEYRRRSTDRFGGKQIISSDSFYFFFSDG